MKTEETPPILAHKHYSAASAFKPENLFREARRQENLPEGPVPEICILDPDGDIVRYLCNAGLADRHPGWACFHTDLYVFREGGHEYGILGCIVGAAFAVLVAEMEAAALYAFARARDCSVLCFAHVTNQMGRIEGDFEKGIAEGAEESLKVIVLSAANWRAKRDDHESL